MSLANHALRNSLPPSTVSEAHALTHAPYAEISEAICLPDLVHATCIELRPLLAHHQVTLLLNGDARALPRVFGNRCKLRAALRECIEAAIVHARLEIEPDRSLAMEILFSTDADRVHLTIRSLGAIEQVTLGGPETDASAAARTEPVFVAANEPRNRPQHIVFPFARVLLHSLGGQVVVQQSPSVGMACTVSLPGVREPMSEPPIDAHHAEIYAGLLTRLASNEASPALRRAS